MMRLLLATSIAVAVAPPDGAHASVEVAGSAATLIDKPLRSGQRAYAEGDLIVTALVSHGAEIIAGGNIHVYAPLRGRALAGIAGNPGARIFCTCMEPELISIAGIYRTVETALPADVQGHINSWVLWPLTGQESGYFKLYQVDLTNKTVATVRRFSSAQRPAVMAALGSRSGALMVIRVPPPVGPGGTEADQLTNAVRFGDIAHYQPY